MPPYKMVFTKFPTKTNKKIKCSTVTMILNSDWSKQKQNFKPKKYSSI